MKTILSLVALFFSFTTIYSQTIAKSESFAYDGEKFTTEYVLFEDGTWDEVNEVKKTEEFVLDVISREENFGFIRLKTKNGKIIQWTTPYPDKMARNCTIKDENGEVLDWSEMFNGDLIFGSSSEEFRDKKVSITYVKGKIKHEDYGYIYIPLVIKFI